MDLSEAKHVKTSYKLDHADCDISTIAAVAVDANAEGAATAFDIVVVRRNGMVTCISGDLETERWRSQASHGPTVVEFASLVDLDSARKGLLKNREDALAALQQNDQISITRTLLVTITATQDAQVSRQLCVYALQPRTKDLITSIHQGLQNVLDYALPAGTVDNKSDASYLLQASNGKLHQLLSNSITTYDLSGTLPRIMSRLESQHGQIQSFTRVSSASLITAEANFCEIYDTTYNSTLAQLALTATPQNAGTRKRKQIDSSAQGQQLTLISFFSEIGLAVALSEGGLVGLQVAVSESNKKRTKLGQSLLIDSLGKGVGRRSGSQDITLPKSGQDLTEWKAKVDGFMNGDDVDGLEKFLAADLGLTRVRRNKPSKTERKRAREARKTPKEEGLTNGVKSDSSNEDQDVVGLENRQLEWQIPRETSSLIQRTDRSKALYCLSKMFQLTHSLEGFSSLSIAFFSPEVFRWLALTGYMSAAMVTRALQANTNGHLEFKLKPGDVAQAVEEFDPGLQVMQELLSMPIYIEIEEVVYSLKVIVQSLESLPPSAEMKAIEAGEDDDNMVNGELDDAVMRESEAAETDLAYALAALNEGLAVRSVALQTVFSRLNTFPASTITEALRKSLSQREIVFFIQLLRIELADGGWTTRYVDSELDRQDSSTPSDRSIGIISTLLNCAIDAIGTSGWLVGLSGNTEIAADEMLVTLRAETGAALEGCHEASSLGIFLNDFERYSSKLQQAGKAAPRERKVDPIKNPGFLTAPLAEDPILPLGYKVHSISRTRTTAGGQVKQKSKSAIGKEISMRVGKYSLDRIRV